MGIILIFNKKLQGVFSQLELAMIRAGVCDISRTIAYKYIGLWEG